MAKGWKENASAKERHNAELKSEQFDKDVKAAPGAKDADPGHRISGAEHHAAKQMELETSLAASNGFYEKAKQASRDPTSREIIDLELRNLPRSATSDDLRHIAGTKHTIKAETDIDAIKNECTGTGKL